ncbi:MAG: hypothetical protein ISP90_12630 [Nevskia sp.]|nr:hypothetical protein [Nevskia sp.]
MKYLLYLNLALAALGAAVSVVMAYVFLAMWYNRDALPSIGRALPNVGAVAVCAVLLTAVAGLASYGLARRRRWMWASQAVLALSLPVLFVEVLAHLKNG